MPKIYRIHAKNIQNIQNTCQKYTDMCLYVVNVVTVACTDTYFMLQTCTYWYIIDTYMVNCGQYVFIFASICSFESVCVSSPRPPLGRPQLEPSRRDCARATLGCAARTLRQSQPVLTAVAAPGPYGPYLPAFGRGSHGLHLAVSD